MNRAEGMIKCRDLIFANIIKVLVDEETADAFIEAVTKADEQLDEALKAAGGD